MRERLQKLLSARGIASRRAAERYILEGRIQINGKRAVLGDQADPEEDVILVDGRPLGQAGARTYLMLHKPRGYVSTCADERGRPTVAALVAGCGAKVWPVGRLDMDSEGLLLMTDDGALTHRLIHPSHEVEKEYRVWVRGDPMGALEQLRTPMILDGVQLRPARVELLDCQGDRGLLCVIIHEGRNRQIRRMCAAAGLEVTRLQRLREGPISLGSLPKGRWRPLSQGELDALRAL